MSFIRNAAPVDSGVATDVGAENSTFFAEMAPKSVATHQFEMGKWQSQMSAISTMQKKYSDLNRLYPLAREEAHGNLSFSQQKAFTTLPSVEHLVRCMNEHDLTMRLNIKRPQAHAASHSCFELSKEHLTHLMGTASDTAGLKTLQLRSKSDALAALPRNGELFVTASARGGQHFLSHADFEISEHAENKLAATKLDF
jgi:hypothetical protein